MDLSNTIFSILPKDILNIIFREYYKENFIKILPKDPLIEIFDDYYRNNFKIVCNELYKNFLYISYSLKSKCQICKEFKKSDEFCDSDSHPLHHSQKKYSSIKNYFSKNTAICEECIKCHICGEKGCNYDYCKICEERSELIDTYFSQNIKNLETVIIEKMTCVSIDELPPECWERYFNQLMKTKSLY